MVKSYLKKTKKNILNKTIQKQLTDHYDIAIVYEPQHEISNIVAFWQV